MLALSEGSRLKRQFDEYDSYHRHPVNKRLHYVGVPLIMAGLLGLLSKWLIVHVSGHPLDAGFLLWGAASVYYLVLSGRLGMAFSGLAFLIFLGARELSLGWLFGLFAGGWIIQGVGHVRYEKRSPAFLKNLEHLLIGPLWLMWRLLAGKGKAL